MLRGVSACFGAGYEVLTSFREQEMRACFVLARDNGVSSPGVSVCVARNCVQVVQEDAMLWEAPACHAISHL